MYCAMAHDIARGIKTEAMPGSQTLVKVGSIFLCKVLRSLCKVLRQTDRETDRQTERQRDRQTDRQTDRDRQRETERAAVYIEQLERGMTSKNTNFSDEFRPSGRSRVISIFN